LPYRSTQLHWRRIDMALLAEELVEEWLNRMGYFTIRGVKIGVHEMDLLAVRPSDSGLECRQLEVQASVRPVSYVTRVPIEVQRATGRAPNSAKLRSDEELRQGIREWISKKFDHPEKKRLRARLAPGPWSRELVLHHLKYEREAELIGETGVTVHRLSAILEELNFARLMLEGAAGAHLVDLVAMTARTVEPFRPAEAD
jgi:hypothetical protein